MKRYLFRLARVERLRLTEKRASAARLAQAIATAAEAAERVAVAASTERRAEAQWGEGQESRAAADPVSPAADSVAGTFSPADWRVRAVELELARRGVASARQEEVEVRSELDARRDEHLERSRAHRVLERLRERQRGRWFEVSEREAQRELDERHRLTRGQRDGAEESGS